MKKPLIALALIVTLVGVACGSSSTSGSADDHSSHTQEEGGVPGTPALPSEAEREIAIVATDDLRFDPQEIGVEAGEVVTFVIENEGKAVHEFVLGDAQYQEQHEGEMEDGHDMSDLENAVTVEPGETAELTWRFDEPGDVLFGCHEPGHYDGGMVGEIEVS